MLSRGVCSDPFSAGINLALIGILFLRLLAITPIDGWDNFVFFELSFYLLDALVSALRPFLTVFMVQWYSHFFIWFQRLNCQLTVNFGRGYIVILCACRNYASLHLLRVERSHRKASTQPGELYFVLLLPTINKTHAKEHSAQDTSRVSRYISCALRTGMAGLLSEFTHLISTKMPPKNYHLSGQSDVSDLHRSAGCFIMLFLRTTLPKFATRWCDSRTKRMARCVINAWLLAYNQAVKNLVSDAHTILESA